MTRLRPYLPYDTVETPISWATRLAALHTGGDLISFLHDIGIPYGDMLVNRESAIGRLCDLTGEDPSGIWPNAMRVVSWRNYTFGENAFTAEFLHGKNTMFCPACLAEDDAGGSRAAVQRRGRTIWLLRPVRTCPRHHLPLIEREATVWSDCLREMAIRVPETGDALARLAADLTPRAPSPLQDYCIGRLAGRAGPAWLDGRGIEHAFRTTEMLGVILTFGPKPNLHKLTEDDWDTAGRAGFAYSSRNEDGVRDALTDMQARFVRDGLSTTGLAGPQMVFGRLYQWLEFPSTKKDPGPIRRLLREHILDTMAVEPDKVLLGELVGVRRRHSVQSLATATGTNQFTVRNFLVAQGMIPEDRGQALLATVDAAEGERLAAIMKTAVPRYHLPKFLNTTRGQAIQLVESEILPTILRSKNGPGRHGAAISKDVVERFLADISRHAEVVDMAPAGMLGIPYAAQKARVLAPVIVRLILDGGLARVCRLADVPGYGGILVDPKEIKSIAKKIDVPKVALTIHEMAGRIGYSPRIIRALIQTEAGGAHLPSIKVDTFPYTRVLVAPADDFVREHVFCAQLVSSKGPDRFKFYARLEAAGVSPVLQIGKFGARIYRRADLPDLNLD